MVGTLENDKKETATVSSGSGQGAGNGQGPSTDPAKTSVDDDEHFVNAKELSRSCSSASSSGSDLLELDPEKFSISPAPDYYFQDDGDHNITASPKPSSQEQQGSSHGHANNGSPTESPPAQVMERTPTPDSSPAAKPYRIPSSVFARTSTGAEWSVASNDSLFSIHVGNMSFTRENMGWMGKSGELNSNGSPLIDYSSNKPPGTQMQQAETGKFGVSESKAEETMREVIKEEEERNQKSPTTISPRSNSFARYSDASIKSFAFPILTGGDDKNASVSHHSAHKRRPSSQQQAPSPQQSQTNPNASEPPTPSQPQDANTPLKTSPTLARVRWFSCFSWCSRS